MIRQPNRKLTTSLGLICDMLTQTRFSQIVLLIHRILPFLASKVVLTQKKVLVIGMCCFLVSFILYYHKATHESIGHHTQRRNRQPHKKPHCLSLAIFPTSKKIFWIPKFLIKKFHSWWIQYQICKLSLTSCDPCYPSSSQWRDDAPKAIISDLHHHRV